MGHEFRVFKFVIALLFGGLLTLQAQAQLPNYEKEKKKDLGPGLIVYLGADVAWAYTNLGLGASLGYGADAAVLQRYDTVSGPAYAGLGAFYLGANPDPGTINAYGAQLLLKYRMGMLALLLGPAQLNGLSGVDSNPHFAWGGRFTLDYPLIPNKLTIGPGGSVLLFEPNDETYITYAALLALKVWW